MSVLYASYDEGVYCTPVKMRGHIVRHVHTRKNILKASFAGFSCFNVFYVCCRGKNSRHARLEANIGMVCVAVQRIQGTHAWRLILAFRRLRTAKARYGLCVCVCLTSTILKQILEVLPHFLMYCAAQSIQCSRP